MRLARLAAVASLSLALLTVPFVQAEPPKLYRVGYLGGDPLVPTDPAWQGFVLALHEKGYTEGQTSR